MTSPQVPEKHRYHVFVSHSSHDRLAFGKKVFGKFIEEFRQPLEALLGVVSGKSAVFVDEREIEWGDEWHESLQDAVCRTRSLICLVSPQYLNSEWCGREYQVFLSRKQASGSKDEGTAPSWIFPILWEALPGKRKLPAVISRFQYRLPEAPEDLEQRGLRYYCSTNKWTTVKKILDGMARQLADNFENHPDGLPDYNLPLRLEEITSAFRHVSEQQPYRFQIYLSPSVSDQNRTALRQEFEFLSTGDVETWLPRPDKMQSLLDQRQIPLFVVTNHDEIRSVEAECSQLPVTNACGHRLTVILISANSDSPRHERVASQNDRIKIEPCTESSLAQTIQAVASRLRLESIGRDSGTRVNEPDLASAADLKGIPVQMAPILSASLPQVRQS